MPQKKIDVSKAKYKGKAFGARLREIRIAKGISIQKLADSVGVLRNYISQLEHGDKTPSFDILISILTVLEVDANALLRDYFCISIQTEVRAEQITTALESLTIPEQEHILDMIKSEVIFLKSICGKS